VCYSGHWALHLLCVLVTLAFLWLRSQHRELLSDELTVCYQQRV
jgi:hypothetical protein